MTVSDHLILADGTLFATSAIGNVDLTEDPAYGLYVADTRLLSDWTLTVGDRSSTPARHRSASAPGAGR